MKNYKQLIEFCESKLGTKYLYGYKGELVSVSKNEALSKLYPSVWDKAYLRTANSWVMEYAVDCSGLVSWFTGKVRGSSQYKTTATETVPYKKGMSLQKYIGWAVWRSGHIGIVVSNTEVIEARGINFGVVKTKASERNFTHLIKLCDISYEETESSIGWHKDATGWYYRFKEGIGVGTYYMKGIYPCNTEKGIMYFAFDGKGYMVEDANKIYITEYGNLEVK